MDSFWDWLTGFAKDHLAEWSLIKVYAACAIAGGTVVLAQSGLSLFGIGGGDDVDPDVDVDDIDGGDGLNVLSVRALSSFLMLFGLGGWAAVEAGIDPLGSAGIALGCGLAMMLTIAWIMSFFKRFQSQGNLDPKQVVGQTASVYLRVPAAKSGKGKITVSIQGRSAEFEAVTAGGELPTGSECRIVRLITEDTFEVAALD